MGLDEKTGILGVSLIDNQLRIVQGERKAADEFHITHIARGVSREPFSHAVILDNSMPRLFAEDITRLYESQDFDVKRVAFSLDSSMVLVKKMEVDPRLDKEKLQEHVDWEVQQFAISPTDQYIIDFEELSAGPQVGALNDILVVVVRKKVVRFLRQLFKNTDLNLGVVDVDVFSAQRALQINYDYGQDDSICLVHVAESKLHFSILRGRKFFLTQDVLIPQNNGAPETSESIMRLIAKELRRIVLDHQLGKRVEDLSEIFLYGEGADDRVLEGLQNNYDVQINRANPFRKLKLTGQAKEDASSGRVERYVISVGAALRGIQ